MKTQERASGAEPLTAEVWKEKDDTEVRWLGGAGFFVRARGAALLLDPCLWIGADGRAETGFAPFYPPVLRPEEVPAGTAVLYTHSDEDHLGRRTAQALAGAAFYGPAPCARALSEIGREAVRVIRPGGEIRPRLHRNRGDPRRPRLAEHGCEKIRRALRPGGLRGLHPAHAAREAALSGRHAPDAAAQGAARRF